MRGLVTEVLKRAREIVAKGWLKGDLHNNTGTRHCSIGAIQVGVGQVYSEGLITGQSNLTNQAECVLLEAAKDQFPSKNWASVIDFNDHYTRRKQHVLDVFDYAIKIAERDDL